WERIYDTTAMNLPDGVYAAHVSVVDMAGNSSSAGWTANFTVDTTVPPDDETEDGDDEDNEDETDDETNEDEDLDEPSQTTLRGISTRTGRLSSAGASGLVLGISTSLTDEMRKALLEQLLQIIMQTTTLYENMSEEQ